MFSLNRAEIIGSLGADPEIRTFQNGGRVATFRVATNNSYKDREGNWKDVAQWHTVVVFDDHLIKRIDKRLQKGTKVHVTGAMETREYDKDGQTHKVTEIVLRPFGNGDIILLDAWIAEG